MAMFLSRLKQVLNLGTKSITSNGTYYASSDGYDGYSSVSVTVPTPPSITPSNSSPAALTSGSAVTPSANGYAIESYDTVVPSGTPVYKTAGSIVQFAVYGGNIVSGIIDQSPSNTNPVEIHDGSNIHALDNGYFIESYDSVTPSSTPASVSSGDIVKIGGSGVILDEMPILTGNATAGDVKSGKTFYSNSLTKQTGTYTPHLTSTTLWTNTTPTSSFAGQSIQLSEDVDNFNYIKVNFRWSTSNNTTRSAIFPTSVLKAANNYSTGAIGMNVTSSGNTRCRGLYLTDDTHLYFGGCYQTTTSSQSVANTFVIPTSVEGLNIE